MNRHGWRALATLGTLLLTFGSAALVAGAAKRERIHNGAEAVERAALDVTRALLREDAEAVRKALDELERLSRRVTSDEAEHYGSELITTDVAFHHTLNLAREAARKGDLTETFNMNLWVQRSCLRCHELARERGILSGPAAPKK